MKKITYQQFVEGYKSGQLIVLVNKNKAGDFVLSKFADKHNKPAHLFWTWSGILLLVPLPIIFLFINWIYSVISFIFGLLVVSASRKSAEQFVLHNMFENEDFFEYVLLHGGATIKDNQGNEVESVFSEKATNNKINN